MQVKSVVVYFIFLSLPAGGPMDRYFTFFSVVDGDTVMSRFRRHFCTAHLPVSPLHRPEGCQKPLNPALNRNKNFSIFVFIIIRMIIEVDTLSNISACM